MKKRIALLCAVIVLCLSPFALAQEREWNLLWQTEPWSTVTVADYREDREATLSYLQAFIAFYASQNNGHNGLPDEDAFPLPDAIDLAIETVKAQRRETEETLALNIIFPSYVIREVWEPIEGVDTPMQPPLWQINIIARHGVETASYCVYIDPATGDVLLLYGDEISHG